MEQARFSKLINANIFGTRTQTLTQQTKKPIFKAKLKCLFACQSDGKRFGSVVKVKKRHNYNAYKQEQKSSQTSSTIF